MKNLIFSLLTVFGVLVTVVIISLLLSGTLKDIENRIDSYSIGKDVDYMRIADDFSALYEEFDYKMPLLSLLVSDTDILAIEQSFTDVISYAKAESLDGVLSSISRLGVNLEHIRELSGLNLKSVF
ncbi:MAG: DUF4363 family protein [Clostridia bacterium]|nr:DUF4363 family protein [Clostridia bacterium]